MVYTDPSGEFWHLIIGAAIGGTINWVASGGDFTWDGLRHFGIGAISGAIGAGVGQGIMAAQAGSTFSAGFIGTQSAVNAIATNYTTSFISGAFVGGASSFSSGFISSAAYSWTGGGSFVDGMVRGFKNGVVSGLTGVTVGGVFGGLDAIRDHRKFWDGGSRYDEFGYPIPTRNDLKGQVEAFYRETNRELKSENPFRSNNGNLVNVEYSVDEFEYGNVITGKNFRQIEVTPKVLVTKVKTGETFVDFVYDAGGKAIVNELFEVDRVYKLSFKYLFELYRNTFY